MATKTTVVSKRAQARGTRRNMTESDLGYRHLTYAQLQQEFPNAASEWQATADHLGIEDEEGLDADEGLVVNSYFRLYPDGTLEGEGLEPGDRRRYDEESGLWIEGDEEEEEEEFEDD